uniref:Uncharacterized protein n=1 Tax=Romanomermis culicivorax TaxID=13658 RepID=A0A915L4S5_ROMCU
MASNLITFNYSLTEVRDITHLNVSNLEMYLSGMFNFTYRGTTDSMYTFDRILSFWFDDDLKDGPQTHIPFKSNNSLIQFFFADNVTMMHNGSKIMAFKEAHQEAVDDLIERYSPVANKLHIHMVLNV